MDILSFRLRGKMAHFRKYFGNNTAFSFSIPPRTTLMGIVAAAMGWPKNSYYEKLSSEQVNFGIRVVSPLKKSFHRLNLLSIKSTGDISRNWTSDFRGAGGRIQTPFEVVSGWDIRKDEVIYQIFLKPTRAPNDVFDEIVEQFLHKGNVFNISLGTANFSAKLEHVHLYRGEDIQRQAASDFIYLHSAIPSEHVGELKFDRDEYDSYNFVEEDMLPGDFKANGNREVVKMNRLLFSTTQHPLRIKLDREYYVLSRETDVLNILFIDE